MRGYSCVCSLVQNLTSLATSSIQAPYKFCFQSCMRVVKKSNLYTSSEDGGRGGGSNVSANSFDNKGGRQRRGPEQTTISQKAAEMAVMVAGTAAAVTEAKTVADGAAVTSGPTALAMTGAGNGGGK